MAVFRGDIRSSVLAMDTGLHVILPYDRPAEIQQAPCKVVYLLHGLGDNAAAWCRYTAIERYARDWGVAVIMPEVQRSFYHDMVHGLAYFSYLTQELPKLCETMFGISPKREDTFIGGLSMGGYGALKCGLTYPERYAGCASFSGAVDVVQVLDIYIDSFAQELKSVLGMDLAIQDSDNLLYLAKQVSQLPKSQQPKIFVTCGQEDFLYKINKDFQQYLTTIPLDFTFREWPSDHNWDFWDQSVKQMLELFLA